MCERTSDNLDLDEVGQLVEDAERGPTETGAECELRRALVGAGNEYRHMLHSGEVPISIQVSFMKLGKDIQAAIDASVNLRSGREVPSCKATSK